MILCNIFEPFGVILLLRSHNVAGKQNQLTAPDIFQREKLADNVFHVHVDKVVAHQSCVRDQILEFELEQFAGCLAFIEQVERVNLLQHLAFYDLAPDCLDRIAPVTAHASKLEELPTVEVGEDMLVHQLARHLLDRALRHCHLVGPLKVVFDEFHN